MTSKTRQYFQSKREDVGMRSDQFRANQIRFNKGQSKAIRNCIIHSMPRELVLAALQAAKKGVSAKLEAFIKSKGIAAAQTYTLNQLKSVGVDEAAILAKAGKDKPAELVLEDLVMLAASTASRSWSTTRRRPRSWTCARAPSACSWTAALVW